MNLRSYDELDPAYQFSSARHFFQSHVDGIAALVASVEWMRTRDPGYEMPPLYRQLRAELNIGLECWEPPPGRPH